MTSFDFADAAPLDELGVLLGAEWEEIDDLTYEFRVEVSADERAVIAFGLDAQAFSLVVYRYGEVAVHIHRDGAKRMQVDEHRRCVVEFEERGLSGKLEIGLDQRVTVVDKMFFR